MSYDKQVQHTSEKLTEEVSVEELNTRDEHEGHEETELGADISDLVANL